MNDRYFKGFKLDASGDVIGAFPHIDVIQECREDLINTIVDNMNKMTIEYCLKFNIDPDVLIKQKAEIELLQMKLKQFQKVNEEILNYIICRVTLGHKYDDSYRITPEATEEEQEIYNKALKFLRSFRENIDN